ncbi:MAG: hypothetical protein LZF64_07315, partial [Nitrosomonas sp.]
MQQAYKFAFEFLTGNGLTVALTIFGEAIVIRIMFASPFRPARGQGMVAVAAIHRSSERKVFVQILPCGYLGFFLHALLDFLIGFQRDQWFVMRRAQRHI